MEFQEEATKDVGVVKITYIGTFSLVEIQVTECVSQDCVDLFNPEPEEGEVPQRSDKTLLLGVDLRYPEGH